jgi:UMF1 family MFS transporter
LQSTSTAPDTDARQLTATGDLPASRLGQVSWALFEFARSPYVSLIFVFVFAPYFANIVVSDPVRGQELWGLANTIVGIFIGVLAPILGAVCDRMGRRKTWIAGIVAIMVPCCFALWWSMPGAATGLPIPAIMVLVAVLLACFMFSEMFHNAMLPSIALEDRVGSLSGFGISVGNVGTLIALIVMLFGVALPASGAVDWSFLPQQPLFGLNPELHEHNRVVGPVAGAWLAVFVIPLLLWTPDRLSTGVPISRAIREGLSRVWATIRRANQVRNIGLFLLARMLYNDGKVAVLAYSGIYAAGTFGWGLVEMLMFAIMLAPFSISGGILGGWVDTRLGSKRAIQIMIGSTCVGILAAVSCNPTQYLFVPYNPEAAGPVWSLAYFQTLPELIYIAVNMSLAATVTAAFANSRSMMARIAPVSMMSQFYGLYALSGTVTAFLGHGTVTFFTAVFDSQAIGFGSVIILLGAGLLLMTWVREERANAVG